MPAGAPSAANQSKAKKIAGCGGCGCLLALLLGIAGSVMIAWGSTDSKVTELVLPGYITSGVAGPIGLVGVIVLVWGMMALKKAKQG